MFEQEEKCLEDDTLTIVLNMAVLEEVDQDAEWDSPQPKPPIAFAQFFDSDFSDFTIIGRDGLTIKVHKVSTVDLVYGTQQKGKSASMGY